MYAVGSQGGEEAKALYYLEKAKNSGGEVEVLLAESPQAPEKPEGKVPQGYGERARFVLQAASYRDSKYAALRRSGLREVSSRHRLASFYVRYFKTKDPADQS